MKDYPCNTCIVSACCADTCYKVADYWKQIYVEYKKDSKATIKKYKLDKTQSKTLRFLYKTAEEKHVDFRESIQNTVVVIINN